MVVAFSTGGGRGMAVLFLEEGEGVGLGKKGEAAAGIYARLRCCAREIIGE